MTDDEIKTLLACFPDLSGDEFRYFAGHAVDALNVLRERLSIAERERKRLEENVEYWRNFALDNAERANNASWSADYWQGVAMDNATIANDVRGQW